MVEFLSVLHIIITVALCGLVLVQDSKGGGALGIGGSGSNSLLGATGAQTLAATMTKWVAILFAASCVALTYFLAHQTKSVVDQVPAATLTPAPTEPTTPAVPAPGAPANDPAKATDAKAASSTQAPEAKPTEKPIDKPAEKK